MLAPLDALRNTLAAVIPQWLAELLIMLLVAAVIASLYVTLWVQELTQRRAHPNGHTPRLVVVYILSVSIIPLLLAPTFLVWWWADALKRAVPQALAALVDFTAQWVPPFITGIVLLILLLAGIIGFSYTSWWKAPGEDDAAVLPRLRWTFVIMGWCAVVSVIAVFMFNFLAALISGITRGSSWGEITGKFVMLGIGIAVLAGLVNLAIWIVRKFRLPVRFMLATALAAISGSYLLWEMFLSPLPARYTASEATAFFAIVTGSAAWCYFEWNRHRRGSASQGPDFGLKRLDLKDWEA